MRMSSTIQWKLRRDDLHQGKWRLLLLLQACHNELYYVMAPVRVCYVEVTAVHFFHNKWIMFRHVTLLPSWSILLLPYWHVTFICLILWTTSYDVQCLCLVSGTIVAVCRVTASLIPDYIGFGFNAALYRGLDDWCISCRHYILSNRKRPCVISFFFFLLSLPLSFFLFFVLYGLF
jgi:hypothetical protein